MPAPKKYTQFIFDSIGDSRTLDQYGHLSLLFEVICQLTELRHQKRLSQHDVAKKSGITQPMLAKIEAGRADPKLMMLVRIARALGHKIKFEPAEFSDGDYEGYLE